MKRSSGILMHITSLPSPYGIGTMGAEAYRFVDFLKKSGQCYWQVLPLHPTGFGDSPYQCFSTYAGNPYLIDLDVLQQQGLLKKKEYARLDWGDDPKSVDFGKVFRHKFDVLRMAARRSHTMENKAFLAFCAQNDWWLLDYALFMTAKQQNGMRQWTEWKEKALVRRDKKAVAAFAEKNADEVHFWMFVQFLFFGQWRKLKKYANKNGVRIIGDIPIYVAADSADVWAEREQFLFDANRSFTHFAGCPPDFFSEDGQFWGNPIYDWERMKREDYRWWIKRLRYMESMYDMIRIDHFRGFEAYYAIERGELTARNGEWYKGPGMDFFGVVKRELGDFPIIAEDLGFLTPEVHAMREQTGYPGMKVLEFAFHVGEDSPYLPHKFERNCVVYTGTHDNTTVMGWFEEAEKRDVAYAVAYAGLHKKEGYHWGMLRLMYGSVADLAIAQMQDYLGLGSAARMNIPATFGNNWKWRVAKDYIGPELARKIKRMVKLYGRQD